MTSIVGKLAKVLSGVGSGRVGTIYKIYRTDGVTTIALQFDDNEFGAYQQTEVELL